VNYQYLEFDAADVFIADVMLAPEESMFSMVLAISVNAA
jgi:hypothetical protein